MPKPCTTWSVELARDGKTADSERHARTALAVWRRVYGDYHEQTAVEYLNLADALLIQGRLAEAREFAEAAAQAHEELVSNSRPKGSSEPPLPRGNSPIGCWRPFAPNLRTRPGLGPLSRPTWPVGCWRKRLFDSGVRSQPMRNSDNRRLPTGCELAPRILEIVSKRDSTDDEQAELARLQAKRRDLEQQLADLAVAASQRGLAPLDRVQESIPKEAAPHLVGRPIRRRRGRTLGMCDPKFHGTQVGASAGPGP